MKSIKFIGYASGIAGRDLRAAEGPSVLQRSLSFHKLGQINQWVETLVPNQQLLSNLAIIHDLCQRLAHHTYSFAQQRIPFTVVGGDHSCAIGTWSGVAAALQPSGPLGLLWIDAHLDSHTFETTLSGNIHGMPFAALLGYGDVQLTQIATSHPKILPEYVCIIGARNFESSENELLKRLGVRIFYMDEVRRRGIAEIITEALKIVRTGTAGYGISLDLDAIDPQQAPAVSAPEPDGIEASALCQCLAKLGDDPAFIGLEIAEFNPSLDVDHRTEGWIGKVLEAIFCTNSKVD